MLAAFLALLAPALPAALRGPPPFPAVVTQSEAQPAFVAPGVARADYTLRTADGPLAVHVVAVDPHESSVRFGAVLAHDRLVSAGETVGAMAVRTGAVAGINADYFDIGATNQPLNIVVRDGVLLRSPSARAALSVRRDGSVALGTLRFTGEVRWDGAQVPLTGVGIWPPQGGASLLEPGYGERSAAPDVDAVPLAPIDAAAGTYRVDDGAASGDALLALGPAALAGAAPPPPGATVAVRAALDVPGIVTAVGGGPLLLRDGAPFTDPDAPAPEEALHRFPLAGAGLRADGVLLLVVVDGRRPDESIGLTRPQFGALLAGMGARDALAFDSGGSATLVARVLGDRAASVLNVPSDGRERPVADGLFVYSDAPAGPAERLALRPARVRALPGASLRIEARLVDAAGHAYGEAPPLAGASAAGAVRDGLLTAAAQPQRGEIALHGGALSAALPVEIVPALHGLRLRPAHPNPDPGGTVRFSAAGEDARGDAVAVGGAVRYTAAGGTIGTDGVFRAGARNGVVIAEAGGVRAEVEIPVGRHDVPVALFAPDRRWSYAALPAGIAGAAGTEGGALRLDYDLSTGARAVYARTAFVFPGEPAAFTLDVAGDGSGVPLRAQFRNRYGETVALTLARRVDWNGWRRVSAALPGTLNPPVTLTALYVVPSLGGAPVRSAGTLQFRAAALVEPGTG